MTSPPPAPFTFAAPPPTPVRDADADMDDDMTFDMAPEGDKNPFVIVLLKHEKVGQYRCHNDNYTRLKAVLENLQEQGHVLNAKTLEFKKCNFDPKMMKVSWEERERKRTRQRAFSVGGRRRLRAPRPRADFRPRAAGARAARAHAAAN